MATAEKTLKQQLEEVSSRLSEIRIDEPTDSELKTLKKQVADLQKLFKKHEGQLKDLNRELHDINKWRLAVEDKIGDIEV